MIEALFAFFSLSVASIIIALSSIAAAVDGQSRAAKYFAIFATIVLLIGICIASPVILELDTILEPIIENIRNKNE